ncbi:ribosomal protein L4 domain-containing protein [Cristinia sonorae]|uniref:Large ribosomal subunit protein uL4m n=1 Tax=Cristinia sonorae TaxID=1940300 RepID=A0A8K0XRJ8_9AGAR|nr:ribosomal protein L4 domain-containing protein [Cristinia sonorae]
MSFGLKRAFHLLSQRCLSTVAAEPTAHNLPPSVTKLANQLPSTSSSLSVQAQPLARPVYLTVSHLVPPESSKPQDEVVELDSFIFSHPVRRDILHLCVVQHLDSLRQGTASTKTRGEVRGSGRKIRPQKGTGKARLGDGQSPMLRGGGIAFGPKPRDFSTELPRKVIMMGLRVALSARIKEHGLGIVRSLAWPTAKTKTLAGRLDELGWRKTLFVTGEESVPEGLRRASSNLYKVETKQVCEVTVYDLVKWPRVVLDVPAVEWFERTLAKDSKSPWGRAARSLPSSVS